MLEVPVQEARMLLGSDRKQYLSTLGIAAHTAVVVYIPSIGAAMLFHEAPAHGPRMSEAIARFAVKLLQNHPEFDPFRSEVKFHIEIGPISKADMTVEERAAQFEKLAQEVREYFPTADPLGGAQVTSRVDPAENSISLVFDRLSGQLARYSTTIRASA